jgi:hypothetical protein
VDGAGRQRPKEWWDVSNHVKRNSAFTLAQKTPAKNQIFAGAVNYVCYFSTSASLQLPASAERESDPVRDLPPV